jgi:ribosomal protein S18 acetylase RimI-like enzyme
VSLSDDELAALFTAAYEGYMRPMQVTADALRFLTKAYDLDRGASRVAIRDPVAIGLVNLGLRGPDAWIGGLGVVPTARRQGIGRVLMAAVHEEARARGAERVWLECIVENTQALALYEELGYTHAGDVEVWSLDGGEGRAAECAAEEAHAWIRAHRTEREPWQRADDSLANQTGTRGLQVEGAAAVVAVVAERVSVLQLAGRREPLRELLAGARSLGTALTVLNLPVGDEATWALRSLGGRVEVRQHEMVLAL